jgi:hypothetical protein
MNEGSPYQLCETGERCTDGIDNDRDGHLDCDDPDCRELCDMTERGRCADQVDNDNDQMIDCKDPDCADSVSCRSQTPTLQAEMQSSSSNGSK